MIEGLPSASANLSQYEKLSAGIEGLSASGKDRRELEGAANKLEGVFVTMLVKTMRETMSEEGLFGSGPGAGVYSDYFDQMMGSSIAKNGGLGIAEMVVRDGLQAQGRQTADEISQEESDETATP